MDTFGVRTESLVALEVPVASKLEKGGGVGGLE